jgi:hypothetical protein
MGQVWARVETIPIEASQKQIFQRSLEYWAPKMADDIITANEGFEATRGFYDE